METQRETQWGYWIAALVGLIVIVLAFMWLRGDGGGAVPVDTVADPAVTAPDTTATEPAPEALPAEEPAPSGQ